MSQPPRCPILVRLLYTLHGAHVDPCSGLVVHVGADPGVEVALRFDALPGYEAGVLHIAASTTRRANPRVMSVLCALRDDSDHPEVDRVSHVIGTIGTGIRGLPFAAYPEYFRSWVSQVSTDLRDAAHGVFELARWRFAFKAAHSALRSRSLDWSPDGGASWFQLPSDVRSSFEVIPKATLDDASQQVLQNLVDEGVTEPIYHSLFREAVEQRSLNPRSSLVLAVAAAEVAVKVCISTLRSGTEWLLANLQSPPLKRLLTEYLPRLVDPAQKDLTSWPADLLEAVERAIQQRNDLLHVGGQTIDREGLEDTLIELGDLLVRCDRICGYDWAEPYLRLLGEVKHP